MGRRDGTIDSRVHVAVSPAMRRLRRMQGELNGFWQTSELANGFLLAQSGPEFADPMRKTFDVLGHIESEVWFPSNQGRIKREDNIVSTLEQVRNNTVHVYRTTLLSFYSAFEAYLEERVESLRVSGSWGPFVRSLSAPQLRSAACALPLRAVLCADICRLVRNKMVHEGFAVPLSLDAVKEEFGTKLCKAGIDNGWPAEEMHRELDFALRQVVSQAVIHVQEAKTKKGKSLPIELFYMLFTFTNLDTLAFSLEEALLPRSYRSEPISRKRDAVRRTDLIVDETQ